MYQGPHIYKEEKSPIPAVFAVSVEGVGIFLNIEEIKDVKVSDIMLKDGCFCLNVQDKNYEIGLLQETANMFLEFGGMLILADNEGNPWYSQRIIAQGVPQEGVFSL